MQNILFFFEITDAEHSRQNHAPYKLLGDTPRVAARIFKQNFKVKCESSDTKDITWQYSFLNSLYMKASYFVESESF
jgi:hypothetical protein